MSVDGCEDLRVCVMMLRALDPQRRDEVARLFSDAVRLYHQMGRVCTEIEMHLLGLSAPESVMDNWASLFSPDTEVIVRQLAEHSRDDWTFGQVVGYLARDLADCTGHAIKTDAGDDDDDWL